MLRAAVVVAACALLGALTVVGCTKPTCVVNSECGDGLVCVDDGSSEGTRTCRRACAADLGCPGGQACLPRDDGLLEGACLDVTGKKQVGDTCAGDLECGTGACSAPTADAVCVDVCDRDVPCADASTRCVLDGLRHICAAPTGDLATGESCVESSDCTSGTCVLPPESDQPVCVDDCAADADCTGDGIACLRLVGGARACLPQLGDGVACQAASECHGGFCVEDVDGQKKCASACVDGGCADGFSCETDLDQNAVCVPVLDTRADGAACTQARECASGHCAHFVTDTDDLGTLCASPCNTDGTCDAPLACWQDPDPNGTDVCGPSP